MKKCTMNLKRVISVFAVLAVLIVGVCSPCIAADDLSVDQYSVDQYTDIPSEARYINFLSYAVEKEFFIGTSATTFEADRVLTRAEAVTVLGRVYQAMGGSMADVETTEKFSDVNGTEYFAEALAWAAENDIIRGYPDGTFGGSDVITQEELAAVFSRYIAYLGESTDAVSTRIYDDEELISDWAIDAVQDLKPYDIFQDASFMPQSEVTRGESTAYFVRLYQKLTYKLDPDMPVQDIQYRMDAETPPILGEKDYQILTDYDAHEALLEEINVYSEAQAGDLSIDSSTFENHNILAVDLRREHDPVLFDAGVSACEVDGDSVYLTFLCDAPSGGYTASTAGHIFFLEIPSDVNQAVIQTVCWTEYYDWTVN